MSNENRDLGGYDQVIQFCQKDINDQLFHLWDDEHLPDRVRETVGGASLDCEIEAPRVHLQARFPSQAEPRIYLELFLKRGALTTPRQRYEIPDQPWKVSILARLAHQPITHRQVREHGKLPAEVKAKILAHDEDRFSIWHLYVELARGTVHGNLNRERSTLPDLGEEDLRTFAELLEQHLQANIGQEHGLHLGFTPTFKQETAADAPGSPGWFQPTLVHHSITYEPAESCSTLNYLMMTRHRPPPSGPGAGVVLAVGAQAPETRMRLSQRFFVEETAIPRIAAHYPEQRLERRRDVREAWSSRYERKVETGRWVGPFEVREFTNFHFNVQTEARGPHGHSARMYISRDSRFELTSDCPTGRMETTVGEHVDGSLNVRFTAAGDRIEAHGENRPFKDYIRGNYDTRKWLTLSCAYKGIFADYVSKNADTYLATVRRVNDLLAKDWEGIRAHVLPGARSFTFKNAGASLIHDFLNLTMVMTYTAAEGESR
ncbi:MAG: hypothetical protein KDD47_16275 [Acidobacteria bacterium]|nr:hypothetical protein [Acidobacteriota bacterium]